MVYDLTSTGLGVGERAEERVGLRLVAESSGPIRADVAVTAGVVSAVLVVVCTWEEQVEEKLLVSADRQMVVLLLVLVVEVEEVMETEKDESTAVGGKEGEVTTGATLLRMVIGPGCGTSRPDDGEEMCARDGEEEFADATCPSLPSLQVPEG